MSKIIPINSADGLAPRIQQCGGGEESDELLACTIALTNCLLSVCQAYPGTVAVRSFARFIGGLPAELRSAFEVELANVRRADGSFFDPGYCAPLDDIG